MLGEKNLNFIHATAIHLHITVINNNFSISAQIGATVVSHRNAYIYIRRKRISLVILKKLLHCKKDIQEL